jgi:hypothetical protein
MGCSALVERVKEQEERDKESVEGKGEDERKIGRNGEKAAGRWKMILETIKH